MTWSKPPTDATGVALYHQRPVDLVIVDLLMSELNGLDTIIELTREFLGVKVIATTGLGGDDSMISTAKMLGARQTLCKPFEIQELVGTVRYELAH
jgi:two-component system response regulator (stage 0 sporulation protein F)